MNINADQIDQDQKILSGLYEGFKTSFQQLPKWYGLGARYCRFEDERAKIDIVYAQIYAAHTKFHDEHFSQALFLLNLHAGHVVNQKKYVAAIDASLEALALLESSCLLVKEREKLLGAFFKKK